MSWSESPPTPRLLAVVVGIGLLCLFCTTGLSAAGNPLPDSLGQWYKPANKRQVWLHTMFAMRRELQAVREYARNKDDARLRDWSEKLAGHYRRLPQMVPEWNDETDLSLIEDLERRRDAGDFAAVLRAADRLERDCRSCHRQYQALTALRYRWPRFDQLNIDDGHGGSTPYRDHMQLLSTTLNRIKIAGEDSRWDDARESLDLFRKQLDAEGGNCATCHRDEQPRERILGADTTATLDQLAQALHAEDARLAGRQLGKAAVQTCARCHGIHRLLADLQRHLFD